MSNRFFHYTYKKNIESILESKTLLSGGFGIYACESMEDIFKFIRFYRPNVQDVVIVEFETDSEYEDSYDHYPPAFEHAKAVVFYDDEIKIKIINLHSIQECK